MSITLVTLVAACGGGPSKGAALDAIQKGPKQDTSCILPLDIVQTLKMQYSTKAACVPNEGAAAADKCVAALVAQNLTTTMPQSYMADWAEAGEVNSVYEHHARNLVFKTCVEMRDLRDGRFPCSDVTVDKVVRNKRIDDTHYEVVYSRVVSLKSSLAAVEAACGPTTHPPEDAEATFVKGSSGWTIAPPSPSDAR